MLFSPNFILNKCPHSFIAGITIHPIPVIVNTVPVGCFLHIEIINPTNPIWICSDGKIYEKCTNRYKRNQTEVVGTKIEIRVNENNPEDVYFEASKASKMLIYILGASFFITGIGMLITVLAEI